MYPMMPLPQHYPIRPSWVQVLVCGVVLACGLAAALLLDTGAQAQGAPHECTCPDPQPCPPEGFMLVALPPEGEPDPVQQALEALERAEEAVKAR